MVKPKTNVQGYKAVMLALEKKGYKFPQASLGRLLGGTRQMVGNWQGVIPDAYAFRVSLLSGVPIEDILPETITDVQSSLRKEHEETQN